MRSASGAAVFGLLWIISAGAAGEMPFQSKSLHLGVATCAGSNCHGSTRPFDDSPVLQNEYFLWQRDDAHSNAYKVLQGETGRRIARNLGIKDATTAPECLTCHTDHVANEARGRRYAMSEGVGCEACHGGSQDWLGPHVSGNSHAQNVQAGLYPLEDPVARARLCLQCHLGSSDKPIDHKLMGAGHPALDFELDTFTNIQPAHFRVDADYLERKPAHVSGARQWAIGQLVAAQMFLEGLDSARFAEGKGMFPELVFFECSACHHAPRPPRWNSGTSGPLGPGEPRLADAYLVTTQVVLDVLAPSLGTQWSGALAKLHEASRESVPRTRETAAQLRSIASGALAQVRGKALSKADSVSLMQKLAALGAEQRAGDYTGSKQIFYGLESLLANLRAEQGVARTALRPEMDALFKALDTPASYDAAAARESMRRIGEGAGKL